MTAAGGVQKVKQRGPARLSDIAADHVRELIVSGQLAGGAFIRPETVAEDLGISATPAREGLLQLQTEGFLVVEPRRGFTVAALSSDDVRDIYDAQALLGGELTARAAPLCGPETISALRAAQDDVEKAAEESDFDAVERLNHQFHSTIYRLGGARRIQWLLRRTLAYAPASSLPPWRGGRRLPRTTIGTSSITLPRATPRSPGRRWRRTSRMRVGFSRSIFRRNSRLRKHR